MGKFQPAAVLPSYFSQVTATKTGKLLLPAKSTEGSKQEGAMGRRNGLCRKVSDDEIQLSVNGEGSGTLSSRFGEGKLDFGLQTYETSQNRKLKNAKSKPGLSGPGCLYSNCCKSLGECNGQGLDSILDKKYFSTKITNKLL